MISLELYTTEELEQKLILAQQNVKQATRYAAVVAKEMRRRRDS
jgi:hypothetical protein